MTRFRSAAVAVRRRKGFSYRGVLIVLAVVGAVPAIGWSVWPGHSWNNQESGPMMHTVERGEFVHEITDRGNLESSSNVEIKCEVKSQGAAGTQILEVIPEGTYVQPGDILVKFDSSALEDERTKQQIVVHNAHALVIQSRATYETAKKAEEEYFSGTYPQQMNAIKAEIAVTAENLGRARDYLVYSERLAKKGFISKLQFQADKFAVTKAELDEQMAEQKREVLEKFTKVTMAIQLRSDIETAKAKLDAAEASYELEKGKLDLVQTQIDKCIIKAPEPGQVVYANVTGYRGTKEVMIAAGEMARERQILIRLPDPKRMQVAAKINEGKIALVAKDMPATIRLDAFPDMELEGVVDKVDEFPVPTSWMGSSVKEYQTSVKIVGSPTGLRPGLTAEVKICVERLPSVLQVPVQAVFEYGGKFYCVVRGEGEWKAQEVQIGSTNDKFVVIRDGLQEGQQVVLNAAAYREKVALPEVPPENARLAARGRRSGGGPGGAGPDKGPRGGPAAEAAEFARRFMEQYDKNHDGRLTIDDLPEQLRSRFPMADANRDGFLDRNEAAVLLSRGGRPDGNGRPEAPGRPDAALQPASGGRAKGGAAP